MGVRVLTSSHCAVVYPIYRSLFRSASRDVFGRPVPEPRFAIGAYPIRLAARQELLRHGETTCRKLCREYLTLKRHQASIGAHP